MATLKSIPKTKVWYKNIKEGDKILIQLHPNHRWYSNVKDERLVATVKTVYDDGTFSAFSDKSLSPIVEVHNVLIGPEGTDWEEKYPATILRKIKE